MAVSSIACTSNSDSIVVQMIVMLRRAGGSGVNAEFLRGGDMQVGATGARDVVHTLNRAAQVERRQECLARRAAVQHGQGPLPTHGFLGSGQRRPRNSGAGG